MAGIEQLEIHSKSYIMRWVKVEEGRTISWSVQPHKKSINFGIVKHPGTGGTNQATAVDDANAPYEQVDGGKGGARFGKKDASTAQEQLANKGFIPIRWHGKCEADKVTMGTYDVVRGHGGMFGLIFDNTFSKQTSKTATFVLLTYPTNAPPQSAHHLTNLQASNANASKTSLGKPGPHPGPAAAESTESLQSHGASRQRAKSIAGRSDTGGSSAFTGILLKRRRKKGQGYARRFFSLDYLSCTLSYYHNRNSSALRGAIPLSLAAIAADERRREINIDSGAEVWHLRASNAKDFNEWARALEKASRIARGLEEPLLDPSPDTLTVATTIHVHPPNTQQEEDREWQQVEALVSRIVGTRDALRRLVNDLVAQRQPPRPASSHLSPGSPAVSETSDGYFVSQAQDKRPFWKRKQTAATLTPTSAPSPASALAVPAPGVANPNGTLSTQNSGLGESDERRTQEHCAALLNDLDLVVTEFTKVLGNSKRRRITIPVSATSRRSFESTASTEEFFDAEAGDTDSRTQVMMIDNRGSGGEEDSHESEADDASIDDSSSVLSTGEGEGTTGASGALALFPARPKSLNPLPVDIAVDRRKTIPPATVPPPSLIAFVRKNVGKDLSTISMPVSSNEPLSALQRVSEQLEYAQLLDEAAKLKTPKDRLLHVTAFAISQFSVNRVKERSMRKPFNPLLGETFELLRTESEVPGGFRLIVEKVVHRPVRLAMHADAALWSLTQSPAPAQKFWGKSAELTTDGRVRVALRLPDGTDEFYSWSMATMFLRNVVMGEKYVEPVGTMTVCNDSAGTKANIEFKTKGMFGGRSEEVEVECFDASGMSMGSGLVGTWTASLRATEGGKATGPDIWKAGQLVPNAANTYGMTAFSASLNEITTVEKGRLPPTDCRLRQDQRLAEQGKLDEAEEWKVKLEEAQRARRRDMEAQGEEHRPRWFVKVAEAPDGEEMWRMKVGKDNYWEERAKGEWKGVERIFDV
ncbi:Oxysterol-binding protein-domain-containing protein [Durotheca rogersii]|uniref:Oxysterol-binding protein-domain-containing protein n=1 Tax=Durotheca rogersii TaxID=419775 RepID=UPI00221E5370|nr:Oxysterol-binding protein-domain-containing protein [Durotheca rogersii]KAI5857305.1 Oxysterol-binding protein-domain-containing protein [Durotheca rogersii]